MSLFPERSWIFLVLLAVSSLAADFKDQAKLYQPDNSDQQVFERVAPDGEFGKPFYLYSKTGIPYRCYVSPQGLPLSCRRAERGEEAIEAMKQFKLNS